MFSTYIGRNGTLLMEPGEPIRYVGPFGAADVPPDVVARAFRLSVRYGRDRHEYMTDWCARSVEAAYNLQSPEVKA